MNTVEHCWTLVNTSEHYWTLVNTIERHWTLLKAIEHYWTLLNTIERCWMLSNIIDTIEHCSTPSKKVLKPSLMIFTTIKYGIDYETRVTAQLKVEIWLPGFPHTLFPDTTAGCGRLPFLEVLTQQSLSAGKKDQYFAPLVEKLSFAQASLFSTTMPLYFPLPPMSMLLPM